MAIFPCRKKRNHLTQNCEKKNLFYLDFSFNVIFRELVSLFFVFMRFERSCVGVSLKGENIVVDRRTSGQKFLL